MRCQSPCVVKCIIGSLVVIASIAMLSAQQASAQTTQDTLVYAVPPKPDQHLKDSLEKVYEAHQAMITAWLKRQQNVALPSPEVFSAYAAIGGLIRARYVDVNEYFSRRSLRSDPLDDRVEFHSVDRAGMLGLQAHLTRSWGVFVEYNYFATFYNTIIDAPGTPADKMEEDLDLTAHSIVTGGMYQLYQSRFYQLRAVGGIGAVFASTDEQESPSNLSRSASATGLQLQFDLQNEFQVAQWGYVMLNLLTRSTSTGVLKTSAGKTLDDPFWEATKSISIAPRASGVAFGFAIGMRVLL